LSVDEGGNTQESVRLEPCVSLFLHTLDPSIRELLLVLMKIFIYTSAHNKERSKYVNELLHTFTTVNAREILFFLCKYGCVTNLEIQRATGLSRGLSLSSSRRVPLIPH
jgi:hypothetical protein